MARNFDITIWLAPLEETAFLRLTCEVKLPPRRFALSDDNTERRHLLTIAERVAKSEVSEVKDAVAVDGDDVLATRRTTHVRRCLVVAEMEKKN